MGGSPRIERPGVQRGYDLWSEAYDATLNPLVALDRRHTLRALDPHPGEWILDAGCGTGTNARVMQAAGAHVVGLDLSFGMLRTAHRVLASTSLVQADLHVAWPLRAGMFDAVVCALVSEHLGDPRFFFAESFAALRPRGRIVFSAFHPELAAAGVEANFEKDGVEYRLGAELHTVAEFVAAVDAAGFRDVLTAAYPGDAALAAEIPLARKYIGRSLLLLITASRP